jgi:alanyl-tRNA synthetase
MSGVNDIRSTFLDYFKKNGHRGRSVEPPRAAQRPDAYVHQFGHGAVQERFHRRRKRNYKRATTSQKSVRAGGKHNDLDNVGYTARHLTFFEMLGNFSFGDYFKERAIELAWNLITKDFGLPKDKLLVTVYHTDDEAFGLWKRIAGFSDDRIIRIPTSDNFWSMGDTGPCGPCSEIFIDRGDHIWGGPPGSPEEDGDRFLEFWNLVFMQYEQVTKEERINLPNPSIDTGMGLERMASILQGVESVFETDLFRHLIDATSSALGHGPDAENGASYRVIADHLRSSCFLIADGVLPSNEGRGYVLRRIMRRAMRHGQLLGANEPLMWKLVPALVREMGQAYPELGRGEALITETLKLEETRFRKTLARGLTLLDEATAGLKAGDMLEGETAFKLYDTYGFPLDLTQDALRQRNIHVNLNGFQDAMERQKAEARKHWAGSGETGTETIWFGLREKLGATEFLGYDTETAEGVVLALISGGKEVDSVKAGDDVSVIVNQTPFYGESGGQVGDTGAISGEGFSIAITDVQKKADGLFIHAGKVVNGAVKTGAPVELKVTHQRRSAIRANHSATHLLHEALREVLGNHVAQKGSLVSPDRLRFDISHNKAMNPDEIEQVEQMANEIIVQNSPVTTRLMSVDDARAEGAMALFGEKYGDEVRVVSMGTALHGEKANRPYSIELCGGTHVRATGDIGLVRIVSDSPVAAGVRRLEALTGEAARRYLDEQDRRVKAIAGALKVQPADALSRVEALMEERKKLERELTDARKKLAMGGGSSGSTAVSQVERVNGLGFLGKSVSGVAPKDLKSMADEGKKQVGSGVVVLVGETEGKASVVVGVTDDLTKRLSAVDLVRVAAAALGGQGGGGRPDMAQAGGPDAGKADEAIAAVKAVMET